MDVLYVSPVPLVEEVEAYYKKIIDLGWFVCGLTRFCDRSLTFFGHLNCTRRWV